MDKQYPTDYDDRSDSDVPPAPSPPRLSEPYDPYKSRTSSRRSPTPDKRRRKRSNSKSPSRSYRRSRSSERGRDHDREKDRSKKHSKRDRSRSKSSSRERKRSRSRNRHEKKSHKDKGDSKKNKAIAQQIASSSSLPSYPLIHPPVMVQNNVFKNDGSFMEMFKKMQQQVTIEPQIPSSVVLEEKPVGPPPLAVGKRRGGRILKTGIVAKPKTETVVETPKDAWSLYMSEVKKYREVCCQEEDNTRPLVK